jgi:hypothetical protein
VSRELCEDWGRDGDEGDCVCMCVCLCCVSRVRERDDCRRLCQE